MNSKKILVAEDEEIMRVTLTDALEKEGYEVTAVSAGDDAWSSFKKEQYPLILADLKMPCMDGVTLLKKIKKSSPASIVIMMTGYGTIESAVEAIKSGAYDYITKPFKIEEMLRIVSRAFEIYQLKKENLQLRRKLGKENRLEDLIGKSAPMHEVFRMITSVAPTDATVLIQGETGTGKELAAEAIHSLSRRKGEIIKLSCAALSESVLESELFGHEKGAFTDAVSKKIGRFEMADGGTLFLDDIDDIKPSVQVKLLRVLQEREFERVGGSETIRTDARIIAASKGDVYTLVKEGKFREDLYYRLNVIPLKLPPLRDRIEDIPMLVNYFTGKFTGEERIEFSPAALRVLKSYSWPGNVRELENLVKRIVSLAEKEKIEPADLPSRFVSANPAVGRPIKRVVEETEKTHLLKVLEKTAGKRKEAAEILGISTKNLWEKLKKYNIS